MKNYLVRVLRDIERQLQAESQTSKFQELIQLGWRLFMQMKNDKNKTYSLHALIVFCIAKEKSHKKYEFGRKVSFISTAKSNFIIGALALDGNVYDGHSHKTAIDQAEKLSGTRAKEAYCDRGYRNTPIRKVTDVKVMIAGRGKGLSASERKKLRRRSAIESIIGHLKSDHRLGRNYLRGRLGDQVNAIFSAAGFNLRKIFNSF